MSEQEEKSQPTFIKYIGGNAVITTQRDWEGQWLSWWKNVEKRRKRAESEA